MANFEVFRWNFSSSTNPEIMRSDSSSACCLMLLLYRDCMADYYTHYALGTYVCSSGIITSMAMFIGNSVAIMTTQIIS